MTIAIHLTLSPLRFTHRVRTILIILGILPLLAWQAASVAKAAAPDAATAPFATVITVDISADLDSDSLTKTCTYTQGIFVAAGDGCTLRRAILEASARPQSDRPIAINFNLASNDSGADLEVAGTWTLPIDDDLPAQKPKYPRPERANDPGWLDATRWTQRWAQNHHRHQ